MLSININLLVRTLIVGTATALIILGSASALAENTTSHQDLAAIESDPLLKAIVSSGCYANYSPDVKTIRELLRIEKDAGISGKARGLLVAAACNESGFKHRAMGDFVDRVTGKRCHTRDWQRCEPTSFGIVQQRGWVKKHLRRMGAKSKDPRFDWKIASAYWARHLVNQVPRVKEVCGYPDEEDIWRAAHRTSVMAALCGRYGKVRISKTGKPYQRCAKFIPRCHRLGAKKRSHWKILARWQREADWIAKGGQPQDRKGRPVNMVWTDEDGNPYPRAVNPTPAKSKKPVKSPEATHTSTTRPNVAVRRP